MAKHDGYEVRRWELIQGPYPGSREYDEEKASRLFDISL